MFYGRSVKTDPKGINKMADDVKTEQLRNALWAVCYTAKSQLDGMGRGKEPSPRLQGALDRAAELLGFDPTLERPEFDDD